MNRKKNNDPQDQGRAPAPTPPASGWDDEMMTTRELMAFLNLSRTKIWELVTKQGLPAFKIGGDYRYRRSEVLSWLENYRVNAPQQR